MDVHILTLGYTLLAGLVAVAFFLGRLSAHVGVLQRDHESIRETLGRIFARIDTIAQLVERNEGRHNRPEDR